MRWSLCTYIPPRYQLQYQNKTELPWKHKLGTYWIYKDTLQFVTNSEIDGNAVINIYELQSASIPPLHLLSSFSALPQFKTFSFSPVSFHVAFVTDEGIIILNIQDSKCLLQAESPWSSETKFSADGHFFACQTAKHIVSVWQNTPTGYVYWGTFTSQHAFDRFLWSPTSVSIMCWSNIGIQLLQPDNFPIPPPPTSFHPLWENHYLDWSCIGNEEQNGGIATFLGNHLDMGNFDVEISNNATFILEILDFAHLHKCQKPKHNARRVTVDEPLVVDTNMRCLTLSHNHSRVIFKGPEVFLYDAKIRKITYEDKDEWAEGTRPLCMHELWSLKIDDDWHIITSMDPIKPTEGLEWRQVLFEPSSYKYHIERGSWWVVDSRGTKLLWLTPAWRTELWYGVRLGGEFLASSGNHNCHLGPTVIEFKQ